MLKVENGKPIDLGDKGENSEWCIWLIIIIIVVLSVCLVYIFIIRKKNNDAPSKEFDYNQYNLNAVSGGLLDEK